MGSLSGERTQSGDASMGFPLWIRFCKSQTQELDVKQVEGRQVEFKITLRGEKVKVKPDDPVEPANKSNLTS